MTKEFSPARLDVKAFAQAGGALDDESPVSSFPRVFEETSARPDQPPVRWSATGEMRNPRHVHPQIWLHLRADATLALTCQRCLQRVDTPVEVERDFRFVADEASAAAEDEAAEEDVLALEPSFDLMGLLEDELLMALPLAPRHEHCPEPLPVPADEMVAEEAAPAPRNPFAVLGQLKSGKSGKSS